MCRFSSFVQYSRVRRLRARSISTSRLVSLILETISFFLRLSLVILCICFSYAANPAVIELWYFGR